MYDFCLIHSANVSLRRTGPQVKLLSPNARIVIQRNQLVGLVINTMLLGVLSVQVCEHLKIRFCATLVSSMNIADFYHLAFNDPLSMKLFGASCILHSVILADSQLRSIHSVCMRGCAVYAQRARRFQNFGVWMGERRRPRECPTPMVRHDYHGRYE